MNSSNGVTKPLSMNWRGYSYNIPHHLHPLYKTIVLCGSVSRFRDEMVSLQARFVDAGFPCIVPPPLAGSPEEKKKFMEAHWIHFRDAGLILIYNGEEDYIGVATAMEIGRVLAKGLRVITTHPSRNPELVALEIPYAENLP